MTYELFQQGPEVYIPYLIISLLGTLLIYGAFPVIFAKTRKTPITKKKYKKLCFGINVIPLFIFGIVNGSFSIAPYVLWTLVFSKYGTKVLGTKGLMTDSDYMKDDLNRLTECKSCGYRAKDYFNACPQCGKYAKQYVYLNQEETPNIQNKNSRLVFGEDIKLNKTNFNSLSDKDYKIMLMCADYLIEIFEDGLGRLSYTEKKNQLERLISLHELHETLCEKHELSSNQVIVAQTVLATCSDYIISILDSNNSDNKDELSDVLNDIVDTTKSLKIYQMHLMIDESTLED